MFARLSRHSLRCLYATLPLALLGGCGDDAAPEAQKPRVYVEQVEVVPQQASATLTGDVQARVQTPLSFRIGGKIIERLVEVGDSVSAHQVLARLDPQDQRNNLAAAQAAADAERARLKQAEADLWRQQQLLPKGYTSRSEYDSAVAAQRSAKNALAAAEAQLASAREQLSYTELVAEADGVITARQAEVGQVVQATMPIFGLARDGERDAVFNVYESLLAPAGEEVEVALLDNPALKARGRVREVTPTVSAQSSTVQVKIALDKVPAGMPLGATVTARIATGERSSVVLPWAALTKKDSRPAVWRVGADGKVELQEVRVARYATGEVVIADGLQSGARVVTAGGQLLHPGQQVEIAEQEGKR
jgi:RND family efflux transporter MFP subunit